MTETGGKPSGTEQSSVGSLWKYVGWFVVGCVLMTAVWVVIDLIIGGSGIGVAGVVAPFIGAYFALDHFLADHGRVPDASEKRWLIWASFGVTLVWSVIVGVVSLLVAGRDAVDDVGAGVVGGIAVAAILLTLLMVWFGYSFWPKRVVRNRERQAARREARGR
jgi:membrane associated rhomboid family serine protease